MKRKNTTINVNIWMFIVLVLSFCSIVFKLSMISLKEEIDGVNLTQFAKNKYTTKEVLKAKRGTIYSSNNEILAHSVNSYTLIAYLSESRTTDPDNPHHVVDREATATALAEILKADKNYILDRLNSGAAQKKYQVQFGIYSLNLNTITKNQIEALGLPGIDFIEGTKRFYPNSSLAPYIIGYARSIDDGPIKGEMGIEAYFDKKLQGKDGYTEYERDASGYRMPNSTPITEPAEPGQDIYLTIDTQMQLFVENGINELTQKLDMDWLTISIMDAKTGAILASGSTPSFNLNELNIESYLNPLTSYTYEPGSTMKIFSFLAAMENGKYDGSKKYKSGTIRVDDALIKDFNGKGWGTITFDTGFANSSNVAATTLALDVGREKLYNYYASLGFGKKTGIELPGEAYGDIDFTYKTEVATASFGQGITTTPIQNLQALSIFANEGIEVQPYIVEKIVNSETGEVTYQHERKELGRKATKENTKKVLDLMYDVVFKGPTDGKFFRSKEITIVGKTGTAQIADSNGRYLNGYYDYIKSFAGVFPYEDPQYVVYVSVKKLQGNFRGVADMTTKIVEEIAKYKNIGTTVEQIDTSKIITIDNYISTETTTTEEKLKKLGIQVIKLGSGKYIINQYPEKGSKVLIGNKLILLTNDTEYKMPNVTGWSSNEVITLCKLLNIKYTITGNGIVTKTSIEPDTIITKDTKIEITLE
jgi:penicillin-binding protein 2B